MTETQARPVQSVNETTWAQAFVRRSITEPGLALDEDAVADWFRDAMTAAYERGLRDGSGI